MAGWMIAAFCVIPSLKAAVVTETFTDYNAFLTLLGPTAQVVNFDDVPSPNGFGYFDQDHYASQGILIRAYGGNDQQVWSIGAQAVSPPNAYSAVFSGGRDSPGGFRSQSIVSFTHDGQSALTSAFGTFFIGGSPTDSSGGGSSGGLAIGEDYNFTHAGLPEPGSNSTFLGLATVDGSTGQLVPTISQIWMAAGELNQFVLLDNFTFATPGSVPPVPEGNVWVLLAAAAPAAVGLYRRRAASTA